ncbi:hypothetical protein DPMN_115042 [Dreissena polymorpha]|uniref:Uncharacterized protein n=1 Tax=Dreissena polymorpha TaxID=45954 RepID=A0A9D4QTE3_DREPO|nr:hypothetical protein DPMN_115042 [Dreissena polymorpha]
MESQPTVDKIVKELGGCGRMQMLLAVAGHALKLPVVFSMFLTFFSVADPSWRCAEPVHESPWNSHNYTENYSNALGYYKSSIPESALQVYNVSNVGYHTSLTFSENATSGNKMNIMSFSGLKSCTNQNGSRCKSFVFDSDLHTIVSEVWDRRL